MLRFLREFHELKWIKATSKEASSLNKTKRDEIASKDRAYRV